eukprot:1193259-Prorocentrum_minimum.AAC.2
MPDDQGPHHDTRASKGPLLLSRVFDSRGRWGGSAGFALSSPAGVMAGKARWGRDGLDVKGWGGSWVVYGQAGRLGLLCRKG